MWSPQKHKAKTVAFQVTREAYILSSIAQTLQAPAGSLFRKVLVVIAGTGFAIVIIGLVTGLIPPPKHALADSSRIISIYFDGQKKVITTNAETVGEALQQANVSLGQGDLVEPGTSASIPAGFYNINVYRSRPVVVIDGVNEKTIQTASQSPRLIAQTAGLTTYPEDTFSMETINAVAEFDVVGQKVMVHRAIPVIINADGQHRVVRTQQKTVGGLLDERDVALGAQDTIEPTRNTELSANATVTINRVRVAVVKEDVAIARSTKTVKDNTLEIGTSKVQIEGSDGEKALTYRIQYQNGIEKQRQLLSQEVMAEPVTKVVVVGTKVDYSANPVELGRQMAAERGWTGSQWTALFNLWDHESGWNPSAKNFWSGACGIPQAYPCSKITDRSTVGQIRWGLDYIAGKYGTPSAAWAYWQRNHSY
jgi:uncharacterized protein YabE (DUF348 family)